MSEPAEALRGTCQSIPSWRWLSINVYQLRREPGEAQYLGFPLMPERRLLKGSVLSKSS